METGLKPVITGDGSPTLFSQRFNEIYHSRHGAVAESRHVFFKNGLNTLSLNTIKIFEVGFGTGLNALLAWEFSRLNDVQIFYTGIELFPLQHDLLGYLDYEKHIAMQPEETKQILNEMHIKPPGQFHEFSPKFSLKKIHDDWLSWKAQDDLFDIVFFDAFAPLAQQEMWSVQSFIKTHHVLKKDGILVTYCSKGQVRRNMMEAGFKVEKLPGPPGKREMLRARKIA
ncbi:MAG: tRNA (5-methylaminomethyl-2-thiouridine)(34)-methyltransferase MnmD [Chitinophagales bacterium]|nr:tRNA (5-methylaminomethyl-2-thiouridine)(34)-methyltransferase MnmD [Chitinophagales bacterium]MDW8274082.1 tRNA (5-methylaminomethyl-2-thiouridine)(34)-methyltransferase MnmD [Chitinophagales bacterium]